MNLLLDQNISHRVVQLIQNHFPEASSIKHQGLTNADDLSVWKFAKENDFCVVTFDEDFYNIQLIKGFPPKIVWFKTGNLSNQKVADFLIAHKEMINAFLTDAAYKDEGCMELFLLNTTD
ncbi:MAG TPA: DUF5615 family PIN-like protein [Chitinophagales bacterium]|nr:DUF5615 family PIN-like protein [Chitinophagales bacterium]